MKLSIEKQCRNMVEQQIRPWDVLDDQVLDAYYKLPRDAFLPPESVHIAYADTQAPIGHGQYALEPKVEARLLQELAPKKNEKILHVGTGSGFFAALLSKLGVKLVTMELIPELAETAAQRISKHNLKSVKVVTGDFFSSSDVPVDQYDAIVLTGSVQEVDPVITKYLREGGRLIAPIGSDPILTVCMLKPVEKSIVQKDLFDTWIPPLNNFPHKSIFTF